MVASPLKRIVRIAAAVAAGFAGIVLIVLLTSWIGSAIPRNSGWREPPADAPGVVEIMVGTNGIHTELVLPLVSPEKDWRSDFPVTDVPASAAPYTHVAVSWGEREVFLNTPTWRDLKLRDAVRAMTGGDALLHAAHYVRPAPGPDNRPLRLTQAQYRRLVARIEMALVLPERRRKYRGYGDWDVFYDTPGRYRWNNTCNQWTSDTLAAAGVRTGWWTPMAGGVVKWVPEPKPASARSAG